MKKLSNFCAFVDSPVFFFNVTDIYLEFIGKNGRKPSDLPVNDGSLCSIYCIKFQSVAIQAIFYTFAFLVGPKKMNDFFFYFFAKFHLRAKK